MVAEENGEWLTSIDHVATAGNIKICDFGLSTIFRTEKDKERKLNRRCGTAPYTAPEVRRTWSGLRLSSEIHMDHSNTLFAARMCAPSHTCSLNPLFAAPFPAGVLWRTLQCRASGSMVVRHCAGGHARRMYVQRFAIIVLQLIPGSHVNMHNIATSCL